MKVRDDLRSQLISKQKPRKRRTRIRSGQKGQYGYKIDLIELHRNIVEAEKKRGPAKAIWVKGVVFTLITASGFALLGYLIAALPIPMWAKIVILGSIGTLGFVLSHFVVALFY